MRGSLIYAITFLLAALVPFFLPRRMEPAASILQGWPAYFEMEKLTPVPLQPMDRVLAGRFPGKVGRFTDGRRDIVFRWTAIPTRWLHSTADTFRSAGYTIQIRPLHIDASGNVWRCFYAIRNGDQISVREQILDGRGQSGTDVSSLYREAANGSSSGPWLAVTVLD